MKTDIEMNETEGKTLKSKDLINSTLFPKKSRNEEKKREQREFPD